MDEQEWAKTHSGFQAMNSNYPAPPPNSQARGVPYAAPYPGPSMQRQNNYAVYS